MTFTPATGRRLLWTAIGAVFAAGIVGLWWLCARKPEINFLSRHGEAEWVIYPKPPDGVAYGDFEISTVFRRTFTLKQAPEKAKLSVRALRSFEVTLNGRRATNTAAAGANWKDAREMDVAGLLRAGANNISVTVSNAKAPPALWLSLETDSGRIASDTNWEASILGAAWRPAWPAATSTKLAPGNPLFGGENTMDSLRKSLPMLLVFLIISCVIVYCGPAFLRRLKKPEGGGGPKSPAPFMVRVVLVLGLFWAALWLNNLAWLPRELGFDEPAHEEYINYIRKEKALPLANQGWELCQPPLYYLIGAGIEASSGAEMNTDRAAVMLRLFGLATGIAHFVLIFLSLRLVFPQSAGAQWFGVTLAACLPEHLYISQYVTNEFLAAALLTAALYCCVRLLQAERESWKLALAIGVCLGAALLTKFTPILVVPFIGGILAYRIVAARKAGAGARARTLGIILLSALAVAGWHYARVWIHFGRPVVHDWDAISGYSWWTDKGFQTTRCLGGFGESLVRPYYSVFEGFWDGIYSSMWGDGFYGGIGSWENRPAWNYTLMTSGFLLALLPMTIILTGFVVCVARFLRRPEPIWFLLLGLAVTTYAALFYMSLKLPYYCNAKAFYGLMSLLPMCAFGAAGWETLSKLAGRLRSVLYVAALVWAMNAYASFWIQGGASATHTLRGNDLSREGRTAGAVAELTEALRINPHDVMARRFLAAEKASGGDLDGAWLETKLLLADDPDNADGLLQSALLLAANGQMDQALERAKRAIAVAPDYALAYQKLGGWQAQTGKFKEAADTAREGLRITPFSPQLHLLLASSLASLGEKVEANQQFELARRLEPNGNRISSPRP